MENTAKKKKTFLQTEDNRFQRLMNLGWLPNHFKKIGTIIAALSFIILIGSKFIGGFGGSYSDLLRSIMLIGLLIVVMSKEKFEDERIDTIRNNAFRGAFILGIIASLVQPFINFVIENIFSDPTPYTDISSFQVIFVMIGFYLMSLHFSKKIG